MYVSFSVHMSFLVCPPRSLPVSMPLPLSLSSLCMHAYMYVLVVVLCVLTCCYCLYCRYSSVFMQLFLLCSLSFSIRLIIISPSQPTPTSDHSKACCIPKDVRCTKQQCILLYADNKAHGLYPKHLLAKLCLLVKRLQHGHISSGTTM